MWWEALPSLAVIGVALHLPVIFTYATNRLFLGNPYKRSLTYFDDVHHYLRDARISGKEDPYIQKGLDCLDDTVFIPEEEAEKERSACP